jgi:hypothetical protein
MAAIDKRLLVGKLLKTNANGFASLRMLRKLLMGKRSLVICKNMVGTPSLSRCTIYFHPIQASVFLLRLFHAGAGTNCRNTELMSILAI